MEVVRSNFFTKNNNNALNSVVKNTSCSRGWLHIVIQAIFGAITVASFVLILLMAITRSQNNKNSCVITNCRVQCSQDKPNTKYEEDVVSTVMEAGLNCNKIMLTLRNVQFPNQTMPLNWMSRMPSTVDKLCLVGGNLRHIPPTAFLGHFGANLGSFGLEDITITTWNSDTFVGLINLEQFMIKNSVLLNIQINALRAVHETIELLTITNIGQWDPKFVTGFVTLEHLTRVDFSQNDFGSIINANSFSGLTSCKVLFLNSCKITSIGAGAFDSLRKIEMLFLNDNYLVTIPPALFTTILRVEEQKPRIHLQDNRWKCDCSQKDLISLSKSGTLIVDPVCDQPNYMHGNPMSKLEDYCSEAEDSVELIFGNEDSKKVPFENLARQCVNRNSSLFTSFLRVISPVSRFKCQFEKVRYLDNVSQSEYEKRHHTKSANSILTPTFVLRSNSRSVMQVGSLPTNGYGLMWYQSTCQNEIFCINVLPNFLRVYNILSDSEYTFCPVQLSTAIVDTASCIFYNTSYLRTENTSRLNNYIYIRDRPAFYVATALLCLFFGAMIVYGVILKNPTLLKGSKRLLFVKHRNVDALVLPPKIPLRNHFDNEESVHFNENRIFTVQDDNKLYATHFHRSNSVRSDKSSTPTYVSAMQPTEAQLAEWRIKNHFDKSDSIITISSGRSTFSWICEGGKDGGCNIIYESLK